MPAARDAADASGAGEPESDPGKPGIAGVPILFYDNDEPPDDDLDTAIAEVEAAGGFAVPLDHATFDALPNDDNDAAAFVRDAFARLIARTVTDNVDQHDEPDDDDDEPF